MGRLASIETLHSEDDDPLSFIGPDTHDLDRTAFPADARFDDAQWAVVEKAREELT